jgi:hypothetical protein
MWPRAAGRKATLAAWLGALAPAIGLLAIVWLVSPPAGLPLYDGIGLPQEPYRYLQPPKGQPSGLPPSSIHRTLVIANGNSPVYKVGTSESPPQAYYFMQYRALAIPPGAKTITIDVRAVPPPGPAPSGSRLDGNVYRFAVTTSIGAPVRFQGGRKVSVELRGTGASGTPTLAQYAGGGWTKLPTLVLLGENYYLANVHSLGDFALLLPARSTGSSGGIGGALPLIVAAIVLVLLAVAAILLIRLNRSRAAASS